MSTHDFVDEPQSDLDAMLAYWVENASPSDPNVLSVLVERYGRDMYRLACILLDHQYRSDEISTRAYELTVRAFQDAISSLHTFRGAPSVRSWLLSQVVRISQDYRWKIRRYLPPRLTAQYNLPTLVDHHQADTEEFGRYLREAVDRLSNLERLVFLMSDGLVLSVDETAYILRRKVAEIEDLLTGSRSTIMGCVSVYGISTDDLIEELPQFIGTHWPAPSIGELKDFIDLSTDVRNSPVITISTGIFDKLREIVLVIVALSAVLVMVWYFALGDKHSGRPLFPAETVPTPTAVPINGVTARNAPEAQELETQFSYNLQPDISADGRWLVFMHFDHTEAVDVYLSDLHSMDLTQLDRVHEGSNAEGGSYYPSVSADGRWVTFSSDVGELVSGDTLECQWRGEMINCMDIFLYDHRTKEIVRVTQAPDGTQADGNSIIPVISSDGRWVAFWSTAFNLVPGAEPICGPDSAAEECWDLYLYNRENGQIRRLPIGRDLALLDTVRIFPHSITDDGSRLALTIHAEDHIAAELPLSNPSEVYLYDWERDVWEAIAVDPEGRSGEGASYLPVLSADGRYLAFVSEADHLVPVDTNGFADVFVRDLENGSTEIVSISSQGMPGNNHSGVLPGDSVMWGEQLGFSTDGRFVTFISKASNLSEEGEGCHASQFSFCSEVYLHDRQSGTTVAAIPQPRGDGFFVFPGISGTGDIVWYVHYHLNCPQAPYCADIILFDRHSGLITSPLVDDTQTAQIPEDWQSAFFLDTGDGGGVHSLAFSPDGGALAVGLGDGSIRLWRIPDVSYLDTLEIHSSPVDSLAYDPSGELLVSASHDGTVGFWSVADNTLLRRAPGDEGAIFDVDFFPDGKVISLAAQRAAWNWDNRDLVFGILDYIKYPGKQVRALAISPDGELIAHGLIDGSLWLRRAAGLDIVLRVEAHDDAITSLAFSPDGDYLASGGRDGQSKLWGIKKKGETWQIELVMVTQQNDWVNDLAFSPDGRWLGVAAFKSDIQLWGIPGSVAEDVSLNADGYQPLSIAFSPDGRWLTAGSSWSGVRLWAVPQP